jgi:hypothetical protein
VCRIKELPVIRLAAPTRPTMQKNDWNTVRSAALFDVERMTVADIE